ncbi:MAG TPA: exonuclease SbcD, partial [Psychrobacter sp.]|nr:exonuclease SbcD [Psychrobacter sp.]
LLLFDANQNYSKAIAGSVHPLYQLSEDINAIDYDIEHPLYLLNSAKQKLLEQKRSLKAVLIQHDDLTASISTLSIAIEHDEKQQQALMSKINNLTMDIKLHSQKIETTQDKIATNFVALTPITRSILSLADKYPADHYAEYLSIDFQKTDIQSAIKQLDASIDEQTVLYSKDYEHHIDRLRQQRSMLSRLKKHFNEQKNSQQQLTNTLSTVSAQIDTKQVQLCTDESALKNLEHLIADKNTELEQLKKERLEVFADKNTESEDTLLRCAVDDAKAKQANAQRQLDSTQQVLAQLQNRQRQLLAELQSATTALNTQQAVFLEHLTAAQFVNEDAFIHARLPKEEREALHLRKLALDNALQQAQLQLDSTQQSLEQNLSLAMTTASQETLAAQHQHIQMEIDQLSQQIGAIVQKLKDNENQKGQQATQLIAINAQKEKLQV